MRIAPLLSVLTFYAATMPTAEAQPREALFMASRSPQAVGPELPLRHGSQVWSFAHRRIRPSGSITSDTKG